jgi:hypothetical protein
MQGYTQIPDSERVSDSLIPLLTNDQVAISRNAGSAFPTSGLVVGMPYLAVSENKLYRLTSLAPLTWVVELDYNIAYATVNDIAASNANANLRMLRSGDLMTGFLTLFNDPTQALHAAPKRYVDNQMAIAATSANARVARSGDLMTGYLTLVGDPSQPYHAATKNYADYLYNALNSAKVGRNSDTFNEVYNNGWYRSNGAVGWYSQSYGGGIWMADPYYVSVYGGKGFRTDTHTLEIGTGGIWTARYGWLENRFAGKGAEDRINGTATVDAGSGGVLAPASFYLDRSGSAARLVRVYGNCNCNCACTCFPAGTPILLGDGKTWMSVEHIRPGDMVMTPLGPMPVLEVETPVLGDRRMLGFADDPFVRWTDDHAFWTRRDGREGLAVADRASFMRGVELGVVRGLPDNDAVLELDDERDEFAHFMGGWVRQKVVDFTDGHAPDTRVYLPIVGGCHLIIAAGYVMSGGANGFDFDYHSLDWDAMQRQRYSGNSPRGTAHAAGP